MRSIALQLLVHQRELLLLAVNWSSMIITSQQIIILLMTKPVYTSSTTLHSTLLSLPIQNASKFGMPQQVLSKVFSETWPKRKLQVSVLITEKENYLSVIHVVDVFQLISRMVLKWRSSRRVKNQRIKIKKISLAYTIGVPEHSF